MKKGDKLYHAWVHVRSYASDDRTSLEVEEWHVTHITKTKIYLIEKVDGLTWVKKSKRHFDYGFADTASIGRHHKKVLIPGKPIKDYGLYTTKSAAISSTLPIVKSILKSVERLQKKIIKQLSDAKKR